MWTRQNLKNWLSGLEIKKYMNESKNSSSPDSLLDLEFPSGMNFHIPNLEIPLDMIVQLSEDRLPIVNASPDWWIERVKGKCFVPFSLVDEKDSK